MPTRSASSRCGSASGISGEYAGFAQHPELQLKWFIDNAVAVRQRHLSAGDATFGSDRDSWGDWVADVEHPAAQYRGRYQLHLDRAHELLAGADPAAADPAAAGPAEGAVEPDGSGVGDVRALAAISIARKYLGTPYHWGGESPETGFDCSGIAQYAYGQVGGRSSAGRRRPVPRRSGRLEGRSRAGRSRLLPGLDRLHPSRWHLRRQRHVPPRPAHG